MKENEDIWKVCVRCKTFNHAQYIEDALNGFTMQETTFPYLCCIIDDASTDGEPVVIRNYLQMHFDLQDASLVRNEDNDDFSLIFARHKTNIQCYFAVLLLKYNHYNINKDTIHYFKEWERNTEYIANCEGDDYWINPLKLQKQVDFLENHLQHSLCFCANQRLLPTGIIEIDKRYESNVEVCPMNDIILGGGGYMATNSMLYRKSLFVPYSTWAVNCPIGDLPLMLTLSHKGKVGYLADVMCVYRICSVGSWSQSMSTDRKRRNRHYRAIKIMWHQFDEWSNGMYHETVVKKIRINMMNHYKSEIKSLIRRILKK